MKRPLNHSRKIEYYARDVADDVYHAAKHKPTAKQMKFYKRLYALCKEHGVDPKVGDYTRTRTDYAVAIDVLLERLQDHGVDVKGNGKQATYVMELKEDRHRRLTATEHIDVEEGGTKQ